MAAQRQPSTAVYRSKLIIGSRITKSQKQERRRLSKARLEEYVVENIIFAIPDRPANEHDRTRHYEARAQQVIDDLLAKIGYGIDEEDESKKGEGEGEGGDDKA